MLFLHICVHNEFLNEDLLINIAHSSQGPSSVSKWERGSIEALIMHGRLEMGGGVGGQKRPDSPRAS